MWSSALIEDDQKLIHKSFYDENNIYKEYFLTFLFLCHNIDTLMTTKQINVSKDFQLFFPETLFQRIEFQNVLQPSRPLL